MNRPDCSNVIGLGFHKSVDFNNFNEIISPHFIGDTFLTLKKLLQKGISDFTDEQINGLNSFGSLYHGSGNFINKHTQKSEFKDYSVFWGWDGKNPLLIVINMWIYESKTLPDEVLDIINKMNGEAAPGCNLNYKYSKENNQWIK